MSRLCSSPEVTSLALQALSYVVDSRRRRFARSGTRHAHRIMVPFNSIQMSPYVAVNKDALLNSPADIAGCIKSFRLPKQAQVSRVIFQAQ
jgi:hypothetical protein